MISLNGKNILVTGATGFIGTSLVKALLRCGSTNVSVLSRDVSRARQRLPQEGIRFISADLTDPDSWRNVIEIDTIFHLAGNAHTISDTDDESARVHQKITVEGTRGLLEAAGRAGVNRFIFASSVKAMGETTGVLCLDELSPAIPGSAYGRAKLIAEELVLSAGQKYGMHVCNLRLPMVFGPYCKGNLPRMIAAVDHGRFPPLAEVNNKRSLVHVDDVIQGMLLVAQKPLARGKTYILTDGEIYSTRQIYASICVALGRSIPKWTLPISILSILAKVGDVVRRVYGRRFVLDSEILDKLIGSACYHSKKISLELGYRPTQNLEVALPAMIAAYRANGC
ncbi:MAG: NAD-dependent epimerase/dehydratase family protein [Sulfuricaulis sp.]